MVGIPSHVVKIVVLATGTDALLRVGRPLKLGQRTRGIGLAQEDGLELIHTGVGKEEGGVGQGNRGTGRDHGVRSGFGGEVIHKGRSDLVGGPHHVSVDIGRGAGDGRRRRMPPNAKQRRQSSRRTTEASTQTTMQTIGSQTSRRGGKGQDGPWSNARQHR